MLNGLPLKGLEINASCPNTGPVRGREGSQRASASNGAGEDLGKNADEVIRGVKLVRHATELPLILKLSVAQDYVKIAKGVEGIVEAISVNSVPWSTVFPDHESPLACFGGGGVSGKLAHPFAWKVVHDILIKTSVPPIGPVWGLGDIRQVRLWGAKAVSFGSVFLRYPWKPTSYVKVDKRARARERRITWKNPNRGQSGASA
jgi:dihydroorotate dehydrogenase